MKLESLTRAALWISAGYDIALGLVVLVFYSWIYSTFSIEPANHAGYVQMLALFVVTLGVMQALAARDLSRGRDLLICSLLMKLSYVGVVLGHLFFGSIPPLWVIFALIDLCFAGVYVAYLLIAGANPARSRAVTL